MAKKPTQNDDNSTKIKIQEMIFTASTPYAEGHSLTALEAKALNQTRCENLRNNFAKTVKTAKEAGDLTVEQMQDLQAQFSAYDQAYTFAERKAASAVDPVEKETWKLASKAVMAALRKKGYDPKTVEESKLESMIAGLIAKDSRFEEEARRRIESDANVAGNALDELLADAA